MFFIILILIIISIVVYNVVKKNNNAKKEAERQRLELERLERERRERERQKEQERKIRERNEFLEEKRDKFKKVLDDIIFFRADSGKFISTEEPAYKRFISCRDESVKESDTDIRRIWNEEYATFLKRLDSFIKKSLLDIATHKSRYSTGTEIWSICNDLKILKLVANSNVYDETITKLEDFDLILKNNMHNMWLIKSPNDEYGNFKFPCNSDNEEIRLEQLNEELLEEDLKRIEDHFSKLEDMGKQEKLSVDSYKLISEFLNIDDYINSILAMWYFAALKPFDISKFEKACKIASWYINYEGLQSLETMIVRIYNWKSMGGDNVVREYSQDILNWVENTSRYFSNEETGEKYGSTIFYNFVSALAWMELYDLELAVLKKLVDLKVQLWADAQERLKFLSSGGTANVKIYQSQDGVFSFDSSSVDWKDTEYDVFFRKLKMKNIQLDYSLAVKKWTKTYPLQNGQKYSANELYQEFESMVEDFDGEVTISRENASALNLTNVSYPDAVIFRFTSEKNRCVTMLFHAEKFGRNLNITILTLFTAENNIPIEELYKYAVSVKNNVYIDSFQEAILESVDEVLKMKKTVYDDFGEASSSSESIISGFFD